MQKDFRLGQWTVCPALNKLKSASKTVSVEPRVMDLLVYLFQHAGEVLPKDQIIRDVWGGAFVTDQALTYAVTELRRALGDDAHAPKFVRTVPKRGYQLISSADEPDLEQGQVPAAPIAGPLGARGRRMLLVGLAILLLTIGYVFVDRLTTERAIQPALAQLTFGEDLQTHATWSPDGRFIAFAWNRDGNFDLFIQALDGSEPIRLTDHPAHDTQPSWSPDGREIAFRSERDGGGLFIVPAFGGPARRICTFGWRPAWSPDGRAILFMAAASSTVHAPVYLTDRDGATPRQICERFSTGDANWHPSGKYVCVWGIDLQSWYIGLHLIPLNGGAPVWADWRLAAEKMMSPERELNMYSTHWAPKGDEIYFEAESEGVSSLWRVPIDPDRFQWGSEPERLTRGASLDTDIAVSPSGHNLAFTSQTRRSRAWIYPFDAALARVTGEGRPVSRYELNVSESELSPRGSRLLLVGSRTASFSVDMEQEISEVPLTDEEELRFIDVDRGLVLGPSWSRDGKFLVYRKAKIRNEQGDRLPWGEFTVVMQPSGGGTKQVLSRTRDQHLVPEDWSRDSRWLLCSTYDRPQVEPSAQVVKLLSTDGTQRTSGTLLSHPNYDVLSPRFSPDDRWICFVAGSRTGRKTERLYLARSSGGNWIPLIPEENNVDQVHWSPDGRFIYCLGRREASAVLLAVSVDPNSGRQIGPSHEVMALDQFASLPEDRARSRYVPAVRFCVAPGHLVVQKIERTGNIWMTTTRPD